MEVFSRCCKQTPQRRRMLRRTPGAAREELARAAPGLWLTGMMTTSAVAARGGDPLTGPAALARQRLRGAAAGRCRWRGS